MNTFKIAPVAPAKISITTTTYPNERSNLEPISFQKWDHLSKVNRSVLAESTAKRVEPDSLYIADWLLSRGETRLDNFLLSNNNNEELDKLEAILIYATALHEKIARLNAIKDIGEKKGRFDKLAESLRNLSEVYSLKYRPLTYMNCYRGKAFYLELANHFLGEAFNFKNSEHTGYLQTIGHRLDLRVPSFPPWDEELDGIEKKFKVILALKEIGSGSQNSYLPSLLESIIRFYTLTGNTEEASSYQNHAKLITPVQCEVEKLFDERR